MSPWIVNLGASDHMTRNVNIFLKYSPSHEIFTIKIVDGSLSKVVDTSFIIISKNLILDFVLLVPNLDCNLLSISKLTRELNHVTKFFPYSCEFQDLDLGKTISSAKMCLGLYLLKVDDLLEGQTPKANYVASKIQFHKSSFSVDNSDNDTIVML